MMAEIHPRVAVVTGASSGIGLEAAKALAAAGWRIVGLGRDPRRSAAALDDIREAARTSRAVDMIIADLAIMGEAARAARQIAALTDRLDVLLNNAGGTPKERVVTSEGNEATFAGNHLGHFLLTDRLMPLLRAAAAGQPRGAVRIINVSSGAHEYSSGLDWNDLQLLKSFATGPAYMNAKLANVLFTRALAKRVAPYGIVAHAVHPGFVNSNFASHGDGRMQHYYEEKNDMTITPAEGADTLIWLATAREPGETNGGYFFERAPGTVSAFGQDEAAAERLWTESEALVARAMR
jgi:NAD(P)-dependent dehydrogenase (short-subunit alcohol dehydrogenase family)